MITNTLKSIVELSRKFALMMEKGNVNDALKPLTNNVSNVALSFDDKKIF